MKQLYFDYVTAAPPSEASFDALSTNSRLHWCASSAPYRLAHEQLAVMKRAYAPIYQLLGADEADTFVFTSSGAEAINHVISSVYKSISTLKGKNHYVTALSDEAPMIMAVNQLEELGCGHTFAQTNVEGVVTPNSIADAMTPRTALVSLCWINGLTGVVNPIEDIAMLCRERGVYFHVDVTHALGKLSMDFGEYRPDFMTFNGAQIHSPKGSGGLLIKQGLELEPLIAGGNEQGSYRGGDFSLGALSALSVACQEAGENQMRMGMEIAQLRAQLEMKLTQRLSACTIHFRDSQRVPHITSLAFPGVNADALLYALNQRGVFASYGGSHLQNLAHALIAMSVDESLARSSLSFSLGREHTAEDIEALISIVEEEVLRLRKHSPVSIEV